MQLVGLATIWSVTSQSHWLHPKRKWALSLHLSSLPQEAQQHLLPTGEPHAWESKGYPSQRGLTHNLPKGAFHTRTATEVFFLSSSPLPQKTDSMCHIRKILVLEKINIHSYLVILHMHFLRRIRLHFLLKSLLPWSLAFESFYPVLPEHLSTQSFVLKKKKSSTDERPEKKNFFKEHLK